MRPGATPARWAALLGLTLVLGGGLVGVDRLVGGMLPPTGWVEADDVDAVPAIAGVVLAPDYMPAHLGWPPRRVLYRVADGRGVWLGLAADNDDSPRAWIGAWKGPPPVLGPASACLDDPPDCPPGWRIVRGESDDGRKVRVLTAGDATEARRLLATLSPLR